MKLIIIAGGIVLLFMYFRNRKVTPSWPWRTVGLMGLSTSIFGALGFILNNYHTHFSARDVRILCGQRGIFGGLAIGMLIVLCLSGEIKKLSQQGNREVREKAGGKD
jgi:hypothetical protein